LFFGKGNSADRPMGTINFTADAHHGHRCRMVATKVSRGPKILGNPTGGNKHFSEPMNEKIAAMLRRFGGKRREK